MNGKKERGESERDEQKPEAPKFISCHSGVRCFSKLGNSRRLLDLHLTRISERQKKCMDAFMLTSRCARNFFVCVIEDRTLSRWRYFKWILHVQKNTTKIDLNASHTHTHSNISEAFSHYITPYISFQFQCFKAMHTHSQWTDFLITPITRFIHLKLVSLIDEKKYINKKNLSPILNT